MPSTREKWPWHDVAVRDFRLPKKLWPPSISNAAAATAAIDTPRPRHSLEPRDFTTTHRNFGSFTESLMREGHSDFYGGRKKKHGRDQRSGRFIDGGFYSSDGLMNRRRRITSRSSIATNCDSFSFNRGLTKIRQKISIPEPSRSIIMIANNFRNTYSFKRPTNTLWS